MLKEVTSCHRPYLPSQALEDAHAWTYGVWCGGGGDWHAIERDSHPHVIVVVVAAAAASQGAAPESRRDRERVHSVVRWPLTYDRRPDRCVKGTRLAMVAPCMHVALPFLFILFLFIRLAGDGVWLLL